MTVEQIKRKIEVGDYILASKLLNITPENVRARFSREKNDVLEALEAIISNREKFIKNYHKKISN
ncbi:hypothetical protein GFU95_07560 [Apibacter sp. B3889]|uniref:hypothetical protein n=1 Tax=unclassified Apibacter TaxID=2630820 RepID=UPI001329522C|nr:MULTISPECIES: hypothetical protein [unclassified Apibacter]MXO34671.1 hypothetical protein [Apibacter sp. B3883]MXO42225.1 hypothetical protein [Apibacter sp. B3889]MXP03795.1 hypothetical protein [Apibacter sp. B3887]MXP07969.1 hypothetical protein [Apibacter sp. B3935]